jgi:hypothetical protein
MIDTKRYLRLADLPVDPAYGVVLYCPSCGGAYSANRGDYFWMPADKVFRCGGDRTPLELRERVAESFRPMRRDQPVERKG